MVDIPDDIDLVDYDPEEEDLKEDPEEESEPNVGLVEGDQTPPLGDMSSDYEPEDEEVNVSSDSESEETRRSRLYLRLLLGPLPKSLMPLVPSREAYLRWVSHLLLVTHLMIDGLASWALRGDLEASRARAREMETNEENATLRKKLVETEMKLELARKFYVVLTMPPKAMSEARMREVIREQVATSMAEFMANMKHGAGSDEASGAGAGGARADGAGANDAGVGGAEAGGARAGGAGADGAKPAAPEVTGCTYVTFMNDYKERNKVKFATATFQGRALTWWNGRIASMSIDAANGTDIDGFTNRFHKLALLCPRMVEPEQVKVEQHIHGLSKNICGDVTSSRPAGIYEVVRMAYQLIGQIIQDKTDEVSEGEKRKGKGDRGDNRRDYNRRQNQKRANTGAMTNAAPNDNEVCPICKNKKHGGDC
ncbi:hypothetical protein Tco_1043056 [Tanacetum coccineum]|uniref:Reverse transcriptase domain-containing protein n=1 Tax=Tanacetum coccineum TaxID=301880 RepID=A0ABQ5GM79_9ASTR